MKRYHYLESNWGRGILALFLAATLLLARDAQLTTAILGLNRAQMLLAGLTGMVGMGFLIRNRKQWRELLQNRRMAVVLLAAVVLLVPMTVKRDWQLMYMSILFCVVYGVFLTYFVSCQEVSRLYVWILTVLAAYSVLTTYVLRRIPDSGSGLIGSFTNAIDIRFYNFGLSYVSESYVKNRNFGIFREPGVYQYFLLLGLYLNNDVVSWERPRGRAIVNGILAVTMLTTFATGGVVEMGLLAVFFFFDQKLYRNKKARIAAITLVLGCVAALAVLIVRKGAIYQELYDMVIGKFQNDGDSGVDRVHSIMLNLGAFLRSPLVGEKIYPVLHALENNTSSTTILFAILGVFGGLFHCAGWIALTWRRERNVLMNVLVLVILFMSFNTENMITDVFLWLMPVMALVEWVMDPKWGRGAKDGAGESAQIAANPTGDCQRD